MSSGLRIISGQWASPERKRGDGVSRSIPALTLGAVRLPANTPLIPVCGLPPCGTIGGPILIPGAYDGRNRTFFFFGYQGTRIRNVQNGLSAFAPTEAERTGNFSALLNASSPANPFGRLVVVNDPLTGTPFAGNIIPVNRFDPASAAFLQYLPHNGGNGLVFYSQPLAQNYNSLPEPRGPLDLRERPTDVPLLTTSHS